MYTALLSLHNVVRWLVLLSILFTVLSAWRGLIVKGSYSPSDKLSRTMATSLSHTQLLIGFSLYFLSPLIQYFFGNTSQAFGTNEFTFFAVYHMAMMFLAIVVMTIGSASARRATTDHEKFKVTAIYFTIGLALIVCAIPWFRPLFRTF